MLELTRPKYNFFDDLANYLIMIVSIALTTEIYVTGKAEIYKTNHSVALDAKQVGKRLLFYPSVLLDELYKLKWPDTLRFEEEEKKENIPSDAILGLGPLEKPMQTLEKSMFVNYYERYKPRIDSQFGFDTKNWPNDWNFARVARNSLIHNGLINFTNPDADPVTLLKLTYSPKDNGRKVQNNDLWPGDIIFLMIDMDSHL